MCVCRGGGTGSAHGGEALLKEKAQEPAFRGVTWYPVVKLHVEFGVLQCGYDSVYVFLCGYNLVYFSLCLLLKN